MIADLKVEALSLGISDSIISFNEYQVVPGTINIFLKNGKYDVYITTVGPDFKQEESNATEDEVREYVMHRLQVTSVSMQEYGAYREFNKSLWTEDENNNS